MIDELFSPAVYALWALIGAAYSALWLWIGVRYLNRRETWTKWAAVALALSAMLYVLSSGPMATLAFSTRTVPESVVGPDGTTRVGIDVQVSFGNWFPIAYAPLFWASEHDWGDFIYTYWELFPHQVVQTAELPGEPEGSEF